MLALRYLKIFAVLLISGVFTAIFGASSYFLFGIKSEEMSFISYLFTLLFMLACVYRLASVYIFDNTDSKDLQYVGGAQLGSSGSAFLRGKKASWPFAKLSVSKDAVRLQTPWGDFIIKTTKDLEKFEKLASFLVISASKDLR